MTGLPLKFSDARKETQESPSAIKRAHYGEPMKGEDLSTNSLAMCGLSIISVGTVLWRKYNPIAWRTGPFDRILKLPCVTEGL